MSLAVGDVARSRAFYGDLLGLPEIERPDFGIPGVWYQAGEIQLHLIETPQGVDVGSRPTGPNPIACHSAFEIEDYAATLERLRAEGIEVRETGAEVGQLFLQDPDGNVIELIQPGGRLGRRSAGRS